VNIPDPVAASDAHADGGMSLEVDALRRLIVLELVGAGVHVPLLDLTRMSVAILDEAVRISTEWLEASQAY
jgi:hypothetical protein